MRYYLIIILILDALFVLQHGIRDHRFETPGGNSGWELRARGDLARHDFRAELRAAVRAPWRRRRRSFHATREPLRNSGISKGSNNHLVRWWLGHIITSSMSRYLGFLTILIRWARIPRDSITLESGFVSRVALEVCFLHPHGPKLWFGGKVAVVDCDLHGFQMNMRIVSFLGISIHDLRSIVTGKEGHPTSYKCLI